MKIIKAYISIILIIIVISILIIPETFAVSKKENTIEETIKYSVTGEISTINEELTIDYTNLNILIYELKQIAEDDYGIDYEHILVNTINPDKDGTFKFKKPSEMCYVKLDKTTLPQNVGVEKDSYLLKKYESEIVFNLDEIITTSLDVATNEITFIGNNDNKLITNEDYSFKYTKNTKKTIYEESKVYYNCSINDTVLQGASDVSEMNDIEKTNFLYKNGQITRKRKIKNYIEIIDKYKNGETEQILCCEEITSILTELQTYALFTTDETLQEEIQLLASSFPTYTTEQTVTDGIFTLHYEENAMTEDVIETCFDILNDTLFLFYNNFNFNAPNFENNKNTLQIYFIVDDTRVGTAYTQAVANSDYEWASYIVIYIPTDLSNMCYGTLTHELTHSIQFAYYNENSCTNWNTEFTAFNEAVANSTTITLLDENGLENSVNTFLESPELSLFDNTGIREYGLMLYPLYLQQEYSGTLPYCFSPIRKVYDNFANGEDVELALVNALSDYDISLANSYIDFMTKLYDVSNYYNLIEDDWNTTTARSNYCKNNIEYTLPYLSTRYFEKTGADVLDSTTECDCDEVCDCANESVCKSGNTFTVSLSDNTDVNSVNLREIFTNRYGGVYIRNVSLTGGSRTITRDVSYSNVKFCIMVSNVSLDDSETINFEIMFS